MPELSNITSSNIARITTGFGTQESRLKQRYNIKQKRQTKKLPTFLAPITCVPSISNDLRLELFFLLARDVRFTAVFEKN